MIRINFKSTLWFLLHPKAYRDYLQKVYLAVKKRVSKQIRSNQWCESQAISLKDLVLQVTGDFTEVDLPGVPEHTNAVLLYNLAEYLGATKVIETGVYMGESAWGLLKSLKNRNGKLISTDIPLPEMWVEAGCFAPKALKQYWELIQLPDRVALPKALKEMPEIDLCYYDSDKSYKGRMFAYPLLWKALRKDGILVSDDINDNYGFKDFCTSFGLEPIIAKNGSRYVGLIVKK